MEIKGEVCSPPQDNVLDLTDIEIRDKCKGALLAKFMKMVNGAVIDRTFTQEDFDRYKDERKRKT